MGICQGLAGIFLRFFFSYSITFCLTNRTARAAAFAHIVKTFLINFLTFYSLYTLYLSFICFLFVYYLFIIFWFIICVLFICHLFISNSFTSEVKKKKCCKHPGTPAALILYPHLGMFSWPTSLPSDDDCHWVSELVKLLISVPFERLTNWN